MYWSLASDAERGCGEPKCSTRGTSRCVSTAITPARALAFEASMRTMRACASVQRLIFACSIPGSLTSPAYCAVPVTLARMSERGTALPTTLRSPTAHFLGRLLDRLDDPGVARAAADIAGNAEADLVLGRARVLVEQRLRHHQDA